MTNESLFVSLYRQLSDREFDAGGSSFHGECSLNEKNAELISSLDKSFPNSIYSLEVDGKDIPVEELSEAKIGARVAITCLLSEKMFFESADNFLKEKALQSNINSANYFLVQEDYLAGEENAPEQIKQLNIIHEIIEFLSEELPHGHQGATLTTFVYFPEDKNGNSRTKRLFSSTFSIDDLKADFSSFFKLRETLTQDDCHKPERVTVFRNSLAEFMEAKLNYRDNEFSYLLNNFEKLYEIYKDNYDTYINGFSLEKIKKEITDYHEQFSKALSDGMNEVVSKSLAIPASIAAGALLMRLGGIKGDLFMLVVLALTAVITSMLLSWQKSSLINNESLIKKAFSSFSNDSNATASTRSFSEQTMENLLRKASGLKVRLRYMLLIVWSPAIIASYYLYTKYGLDEKFSSVFLIMKDLSIKYLAWF